MSDYNRFGTPRAYVDMITYGLASGWRDLDDITTLKPNGNQVTFNSNTSESDMFDGKPSNYAQIDDATQQFYIQFNTGFSTDSLAESNFIAILNHNFNSADAVFKVEVDDASDMASPTIVSTTGQHDKLINADADSTANYIDPATDGWTLITYPQTGHAYDVQVNNNQYVRLTIEDDSGTSSNFNEDVKIGSIMFGELYNFPRTPNLDIKTSVEFDGIELTNSIGGNTYSTAKHLGKPVWGNSLPFHADANTNQNSLYSQRFGRVSHSMNFTYLADTEVFSQNSNSLWFDTTSFHNSFINKVYGQHLPFLFSLDGAATATGDYGMFRLASEGFSATQVANRAWNIGLDIVETW